MDPISTARVLDLDPVPDLAAHRRAGGGRAVDRAATAAPEDLIEVISAAGLRGRGGAGFPTAQKWQTVRTHADSASKAPTVVVNAAEGEPGSFKDRLLIRRNPFKVLEGALVAARAIGADRVVVATKASFRPEVGRLHQAIREVDPGPAGVGRIDVVEGPDSYLFGEETALLEVVAGRPPFPRVAPPWRRGVDGSADAPQAAAATMASPGRDTHAAPTLVNNVETLAHVADIVAHGPDRFREVGRGDQPGTFLCTVTGDARHHGVVEVPVGTTVADVLDLGGGPSAEPVAVLPGVSHRLVPAGRFDSGLAYGGDDVVPAGSGALRFVGRDTDLVALAAGVARFLAIESCGQCTPCKRDGLALRDGLAALAANDTAAVGGHRALDEIADRARDITDEARCALAGQLQGIVAGLLEDFAEVPAAHLGALAAAVDPVPVTPLRSIDGGVAVHDHDHLDVQPDWSRDEVWSGSYPAQAVSVRT